MAGERHVTPSPSKDHAKATVTRLMDRLVAHLRLNPYVIALILIPILVQLPYLLGIVQSDPTSYMATMDTTPASQGVGALLGGQPWVDPNIGLTALTLGRQAAQQWLSGSVPWWNPYEGVGWPLLGNLPAQAMFPLTLLLPFNNGQLVFHICLEILAGVSTFYLLRRLRLWPVACLVGAVLFELNSCFAWQGSVQVNPLPFLPLALLGVECALSSTRGIAASARGRPLGILTQGWQWIAVAIAGSLLGGFPETAYLDGLLIVVWSLLRLPALADWARRLDYLARLTLGALVGVLIAAPLLVAFASTLSVSDASYQNGAFDYSLSGISAAKWLFPYIYGNNWQFTLPWTASAYSEGNYFGLTAMFLAALGLIGDRYRLLRIGLAGWILVTVGSSFGFAPFHFLLGLIPGMALTKLPRFVPTSDVMAIAVLAAFALDEWRGTARDKARAAIVAAGAVVGLGGVSLLLAAPAIHDLVRLPAYGGLGRFFGMSLAVEGLTLLTVLLCLFLLSKANTSDAARSADTGALARQVSAATKASPTMSSREPRSRATAVAMTITGCAIILLSMGYFALPMLSAPRAMDIDMDAVHFLQTHTGLARVYSVGPLNANWGSYWDIADIQYNDIPIPTAYEKYVRDHLDPDGPYLSTLFFQGVTPGQIVAPHLKDFEALGVKYILAYPSWNPFGALAQADQPPMVYEDSFISIYELQDPAPYFSTQDSGCALAGSSWNGVTLNCPSPTTLVRRSLTFPGWHADVNGHEAPISTYGEIFEEISVPAGVSHVSFWFLPPGETVAAPVGIAALLFLIAAAVLDYLLRRPPPSNGGRRWSARFAIRRRPDTLRAARKRRQAAPAFARAHISLHGFAKRMRKEITAVAPVPLALRIIGSLRTTRASARRGKVVVVGIVRGTRRENRL